jgi:hypothetical protein
MAGRSVEELAAEAERYTSLNTKLARNVAHLILSPSPDDPMLAAAHWEAIAEKFMGAMGFGNAAWVAVIHRDTGIPHIHIAACRVDMDGKTISDSNDFRRAETAIRRIEREFGLVAVVSPNRKPGVKAPKQRTRSDHLAARRAAPKRISKEKIMTDTNQNSPHPGDKMRHVDAEAVLTEYARAKADEASPGARLADDLTDKKRRAVRRLVIEKDPYRAMLDQLFGPELTHIWHSRPGPVLYFEQSGQILDTGDSLAVLGGMDETKAAKRVVMLAVHPSRGWSSISFTGSATFVERAMREALEHRITIRARDGVQAAILAKIMAERAGGMASATGPIPAGAVPAGEGLEDLEPMVGTVQTRAETAPTPQPVATPPAEEPSTHVVSPLFRHLRERLQERRERAPSEDKAVPLLNRPAKPLR